MGYRMDGRFVRGAGGLNFVSSSIRPATCCTLSLDCCTSTRHFHYREGWVRSRCRRTDAGADSEWTMNSTSFRSTTATPLGNCVRGTCTTSLR